MFNRSWRLPSRRLVLTGIATLTVATVAGGVAYSAGVASQQPAIQTSTPRSEKQVTNIFTKLDLPPADHSHRRVLAVLRWLGA